MSGGSSPTQTAKFNIVHTNKPAQARHWRSDLCMYSQLCAAEQHHKERVAQFLQQQALVETQMLGVNEQIISLKHLAVEACLYQERVGSTTLLEYLMTKNACKNLVEQVTQEEGNDAAANLLEKRVGSIPSVFVSRLLYDIGVIYVAVLAHQRNAYRSAGGKTEFPNDDGEDFCCLHVNDRALVAESKRLTLKSLRELPLWQHQE